MKSAPARLFLSVLSIALVSSASHGVALDRPPEILDIRQVGTTVRLLWSPGGDSDGTLYGDGEDDVVLYKVERRIGNGAWAPICSNDAKAMTCVDDIEGEFAWGVGPTFQYRVVATTEDDNVTTISSLVAVQPARMRIAETRGGKARLDWIPAPSQGPPGYPLHLGYVVEKKGFGNTWSSLTNPPLSTSTLSYIHLNTTTGTSTYRVRSVYQQNPGTATTMLNTTGQSITIEAMCEGQEVDPTIPPLHVVEIGDLDENGHYEGADIEMALQLCQQEQYERLGDGIGNNDGVCTQEDWMQSGCIDGGCVLRALPVTYENVALRITSQANCSAGPTVPLQCIPQGSFPAGLVIEGEGPETVFRSPLWHSLGTPVPLPAPVLEIHRQDFQFGLRNLVLDGRKFEQKPPGTSSWVGWWYGGLYVWKSGEVREIADDGLGDGDVICEKEVCVEAEYEDGVCEPGEVCSEVVEEDGGDDDGNCDTDHWTTTPGCESTRQIDDGCIHNVVVRDIPGAHAVAIDHANGWIIEDNEIHDVGCVNRGYGYDCPNFASAADAVPLSGFKTFGIALNVNAYTANFKVRRNEVVRATKYGLNLENDKGTCNGLVRNHEVYENEIRDIGAVGIFNYGSVGAWIHDNTIVGTTTWNAPDSMNGDENSFGMSLGGYCSDANVFERNRLVDMAGVGILWHGDPQTVECDGGSCDPVTPVGNVISANDIDGTCLEKVTTWQDPQEPPTTRFKLGSIFFSWGAGGALDLIDNTLTNSQCRVPIFSNPGPPSISPLDVQIAGGSYETGPNAATDQQDGICGALYLHGTHRTFTVGEDTSIANTLITSIPKACVGEGATLTIRDAHPSNPFADGDYTAPVSSGGASIIQCSNYDDYPSPEAPDPPAECQ